MDEDITRGCPSALPLHVQLDHDYRCFSVFVRDGREFGVTGLTGTVEINAVRHSMNGCQNKPVCDEGEVRSGLPYYLTYCFDQPKFEWQWRLHLQESELTIAARIKNTGSEPFSVGEWSIVNTQAECIPMAGVSGGARFLQWHPWDMQVELMSSRTGHTSDNLCLIHEPGAGLSLMGGFVTLDRMRGLHSVTYDPQRGVTGYAATCHFGEYKLEPGDCLDSEVLSISIHTDPYGALEHWAEAVCSIYRPVFGDLPPVGWIGGWTDSFSDREDCWERFALGNAKAIREKLKGFDVGYIWTSQNNLKDAIPGNWLANNDCQIPSGQKEFFSQLISLGYRPGLWIAPFWFYSEAEGMLERCRDFLLRDEEGNPVCEVGSWGGDYDDEFSQSCMHKYFLDGSNPKAIAFIRQIFAYYRSIGVRYYMLDFLGIIQKSRMYDPSQTPLMAARSMMHAIREEAGADTHMQTAVSSIPGYVGIIDAARVGRDFGEGRPLQGGPLSDWRNATHVLHDNHYSNAYYLLQNAAISYFTHRKLYMNDFNLLTIDKPIPLDLAQIAVTVFGLSGGSPLMLGDDYLRIDDERLRMVKLCLPRTQRVARPADLFDHVRPDDYCRILTLRVDKGWGSWLLAAVFNLDDAPYTVELDFQSLGLDAGKPQRIWEFWTEEYCGTYAERFTAVIPPNSCRLFRLSEARNYPWLLSTDLHVQQGAVEIDELNWDPETMCLSGSLSRPAGERGSLFLLMPRKYRVINHEGLGLMKELIDMNVIVRMPLSFQKGRVDFRLFFELWEPRQIVLKHFFPYETEKEWLQFKEKARKPGDTRIIE